MQNETVTDYRNWQIGQVLQLSENRLNINPTPANCTYIWRDPLSYQVSPRHAICQDDKNIYFFNAVFVRLNLKAHMILNIQSDYQATS